MNILFISNQHYPSGMAGTMRIRGIAEYLATKATSRVLITGNNNGTNSLSGTKNNVSYNTLGISGKSPIHLLLMVPINAIRIRKILRKYKNLKSKNFIIIYDGISIDNILVALIGKRLGYKIITDIVEDYTLHEEKISRLHALKLNINTFFERYINSIVDGIIVLSKHLEKKYTGIFNNSNMIINIPISAMNIETELSPSVNDNDEISFVYSGTYGEKDGVVFLIEAFDSLSKKYPNIRLVLAGKSKKNINETIEKYNNSSISFIGLIPHDSYYPFLAKADVLCMTRVKSKYASAGFPFKLGEYLATGKPVITTEVSDINFYLKDKVDTVMAEPSNIESLVKAMEFLILNKEKGKEIGIKGREKALQYFNPQVNGELLYIFLNQM